ncbi:MAG: monovalent cation/H+ antiporter complex subunit F [bacterium]
MIIEISVLLILLACGLTFVRLIKGPTVPDRIVAANAIGIMFFSLIILLTYVYGTDVFLDVALVYAILQFAEVLVMARYLGRRERLFHE